MQTKNSVTGSEFHKGIFILKYSLSGSEEAATLKAEVTATSAAMFVQPHGGARDHYTPKQPEPHYCTRILKNRK